MACAYCYVPRRKGFSNPISLFVNVDAVCAAMKDVFQDTRSISHLDPATLAADLPDHRLAMAGADALMH